jgi:hypothetical protein
MTAAKKRPKVFYPPNEIRSLLLRPGGKSRDEAIGAAIAGIETLRGISMEAIDGAIEAVGRVARPGHALSDRDLNDVTRQADLIVTLAGTFGLTNLDAAGRSLCDLARALKKTSPHPSEPVAVHARALRLFAPGKQALGVPEAELVFEELAKFRAFFESKTAAE